MPDERARATIARLVAVLAAGTTLGIAESARADKPDWCGTWAWHGGAYIGRTDRPWCKGTFVSTAWAKLEPRNGSFDWSVIDGQMQRAAENGLYVMVKIYHACGLQGSP